MKTVTPPNGKFIARSSTVQLLSVALCAVLLTACGGGGGGGGGGSSSGGSSGGSPGGGGTPGPVTSAGTVSTPAGSGTSGFLDALDPKLAMFKSPMGVAVDAAGNTYVVDDSDSRIRQIAVNGEVSTIAGTGLQGHVDGFGKNATFYAPSGVAVDAAGNLYVADSVNHSIRKIAADSNRQVTTYAGDGTYTSGLANGMRTSAKFNLPMGVAVDGAGNVYVADSYNNVIRKIDAATGNVTTLAGSGANGSANGPSTTASFSRPTDLAVNAAGTLVYVAEPSNVLIRKIDVAAGTVSTLAGAGYTSPVPTANCKGVGTAVTLGVPQNITLDAAGNVYVANTLGSLICKITAGGVASIIAGTGTSGSKDGAANQATFNLPHGLAFDKNGNLYIADTGSYKVRKITF